MDLPGTGVHNTTTVHLVLWKDPYNKSGLRLAPSVSDGSTDASLMEVQGW